MDTLGNHVADLFVEANSEGEQTALQGEELASTGPTYSFIARIAQLSRLTGWKIEDFPIARITRENRVPRGKDQSPRFVNVLLFAVFLRRQLGASRHLQELDRHA